MTNPVLSSDPLVETTCCDSSDIVQILIKLQRAAQLITSTLDLELLLDRVVNDLASSIGKVEVSVWLRDDEDLVLYGVRGCKVHKRGDRLGVGREGMVGYAAALGEMYYAPDVRQDPYYIACDGRTRSEVALPLIIAGKVTGVLSISHFQIDGFSADELRVLQAVAGHIAIAIENARILERERTARERLERDAADARAIQQGLFLKATRLFPDLPSKQPGIRRAQWPETGSISLNLVTSDTVSSSPTSPAKALPPPC